MELPLGLVYARDIVEANLDVLLARDLAPALAEGQHPAARPLDALRDPSTEEQHSHEHQAQWSTATTSIESLECPRR
jgi:hypothetical protein